MEYRNPTIKQEGAIECEVNHPEFGWIPFTCVPDDTGAKFDTKELYDKMLPFAVSEVVG
jgi:hypothetical protein